jgi:hypothetical protein
MFTLSSYISYILSPLNVVLFQSYKHFHAKTINNATHTDYNDFNKIEFLAIINDIR